MFTYLNIFGASTDVGEEGRGTPTQHSASPFLTPAPHHVLGTAFPGETCRGQRR